MDVLEIQQFGADPPVINLRTLTQATLEEWLESSTSSPDQYGKSLTSELRLILGPAPRIRVSPKDLPSIFPNDPEDLLFKKSVPFSRDILEQVIDKFHLPASTAWLLVTNSSHVQKYTMDTNGSPNPRIGFTLRRSTRGIVAVDFKLSISHNPKTGQTYGLLLGCAHLQMAFLVEELKKCSLFAWHPLLLPCLLTSHHQELLGNETQNLWSRLIGIETISGQTGAPAIGAPVIGALRAIRNEGDFLDMIKGILGVVQLTAAWQSHANGVILSIEVIKDGLFWIKDITPGSRKTAIDAVTQTLVEYLQLLSHMSKVMMGDLQYINSRGQAQTGAIYNLLAKQDNQFSQQIAAQSLDLSEDSRQIAAASKRDSSAMKGIAILTMVFLPGSYISALFAVPVFNFSSDSRVPQLKRTFWLYWAVTAPLTIVVLIAYLSYAALIKRKHHHEDRKVKDRATGNPTSGSRMPLEKYDTSLTVRHQTMFPI